MVHHSNINYETTINALSNAKKNKMYLN